MIAGFSWSILFFQLLHLLLACVAGAALFQAVRFIRRQSTAVGYVVVAAILLRAILGLSLFWVSYLEIPVARSLQLGGGFWSVMPDAVSYYWHAVDAAERGLDTVNPAGSSPTFVRILGVWMRAVGVSPAAGLFLNLCLFGGLLATIVRLCAPVNDWKRDLPLVIGAASFSFSPVMLINSTQALKDDLFITLIAAVCVGAFFVLPSLTRDAGEIFRRVDAVAGLAVLFVSVYCLAGIRDYFAVIVWIACSLVLTLFIRRPIRVAGRYAAASVLVLSMLWLGYVEGAGPYYRGPTLSQVTAAIRGQTSEEPSRHITDTLDHQDDEVGRSDQVSEAEINLTPEEPIAKVTSGARRRMNGRHAQLGVEVMSLSEAALVVDHARKGFVLAGGDTNIVPETSSLSRAKALVLGLAATFVPISALKALSVIRFTGGRALLPLTDLDTVFMDLSLLCAVAILFARRRSIGRRLPFATFAMILSSVTAVLLAYVVTNFGTLFRMRLMVAVPIWLLMLALPTLRSEDASSTDRNELLSQPRTTEA